MYSSSQATGTSVDDSMMLGGDDNAAKAAAATKPARRTSGSSGSSKPGAPIPGVCPGVDGVFADDNDESPPAGHPPVARLNHVIAEGDEEGDVKTIGGSISSPPLAQLPIGAALSSDENVIGPATMPPGK